MNRNNDANNAESVSFYVSLDDQSEEEAFVGKVASFRRTWCLDSGCTAHLCKDTDDFIKIEEIKSGRLNLASSASTDI